MSLRHSDHTGPGISRKRKGRFWQYFDAAGERVTDREEIDRLNAIALPPAYRDAWFSPYANGHIQAFGYDEKGRKQYRYHKDFRSKRDSAKYALTREFGLALPKLRKRVAADLRKRTLSRDAVVAAVIRLMDRTHIRIGNEAYAKSNNSYGATTLRNRHAKVRGGRVQMRFRAKSGIERELSITDASLTRIVKRCQDLPGQNLFQYIDEKGAPQPVSSTDVNDYLRGAMGEDFTAKHFRTWGASALAFEQICGGGGEGIGIKALSEPVAEALGNTPSMARNSYIHPALVEEVKAGKGKALAGLQCPIGTKYLSGAERGLLDFLGKTSKRRAKRS